MGQVDAMHQTLQLLAKTFSVSQSRSIFVIKYKIDLFIKHKSMTEFGQGNFVSFPITIRSVAQKIPVLEKYQTQLLKAFANGFNPTKINPLVACGIIQNDMGEIEPIIVLQRSKVQIMVEEVPDEDER